MDDLTHITRIVYVQLAASFRDGLGCRALDDIDLV
jgi:hypothetical protein